MTGGQPLLVATNNPHKVTEFRRILQPLGVVVISPEEARVAVAVDETGATFAENALLKARGFSRASGLPAVADDSGLVVDALNGEPGLYSARYGGPGLDDGGRVTLVLKRMEGVEAERRTARFVSAIGLVRPDGEWVFEGVVDGMIADRPEGGNGFGYDPIFYYPPFGLTFGQTDPAQKDRVSHRGRALQALAKFLSAR